MVWEYIPAAVNHWMYNVLRTNTWWLFLANVTTYPSDVIFKPQQRETYTKIKLNFKTVAHLFKLEWSVARKFAIRLEKKQQIILIIFTLTCGHSNSDCKTPSREKQATWKRLPCESPIKMSPASEISIPFGKQVIFSLPIRYLKLPSCAKTATQWPLKSHT